MRIIHRIESLARAAFYFTRGCFKLCRGSIKLAQAKLLEVLG